MSEDIAFTKIKIITDRVRAALKEGYHAQCFQMVELYYIQITEQYPFHVGQKKWKHTPGFSPQKVANLSPLGIDKTVAWIIEQGKVGMPEAFR